MRRAAIALSMLGVVGAAVYAFTDDGPASVSEPTSTASAEPEVSDAGDADRASNPVEATPSLFGFVTSDEAPVAAFVHVGVDTVRANAEGRFTYRGAAEGKVEVWAELGVLRSTAIQVDLIPGDTAQLALELHPPATVSGHVTSGPDRKPVANVRVRFDTARGEELSTGADGAFKSTAVRAGPNRVELDAPAPWASRVVTVQLDPDRDNEVELSLELELFIEGNVRTPAGEPVSGAEVHLRRGGDAELIVASKTDGSFSFPRVVRAAHTLYAQQGMLRSPTATTGPARGLVLIVTGGARLDLTIVRRDKPASGLEVALTPERRPPDADLTGSPTGPGGVVRLESLSPKAYVVWAREPRRAWRQLGSVVLSPGLNAETMNYAEDGLTVRVRTVDAIDERPIAGALVRLSDEKRTTDADGYCLFDDIQPQGPRTSWRDADIVATAKDHAPGYGWVNRYRPERENVVTLSRLRTMRGEAFGADGKALRSIVILGRQVATAPTGKFELPVPVMTMSFIGRAGCPFCRDIEFTVPSGFLDFDIGRLTFPVGGVLDVTVLRPDGRPARFASVHTLSSAGDARWLRRGEATGGVRTDDRGHAAWRIPPERRWIVATAPDFAPSARAVVDGSGAGSAVTLQLSEAAEIEGVVTRRGKTIAGHPVYDEEEGVVTVTDGAGHYVLGPLSAGNHHVHATGTTSAFVAVSSGQRRTADLTISGRLFVEVLEPMMGPLEVYAAPGDVDEHRMERHERDEFLKNALRVSTDGPVATFENLSAGLWTVWIIRGFSWKTTLAVVPEDGDETVRLSTAPMPWRPKRR